MKRTSLKRDTPKAKAWAYGPRKPMDRGEPLKARGRKHAQHQRERFGAKAVDVRRMPCLVCGVTPSDPHHEPPISLGGASKGLVPLCRRHHNVRHQIGPTRFNERYGVDLVAEAARIEAEWRETA